MPLLKLLRLRLPRSLQTKRNNFRKIFRAGEIGLLLGFLLFSGCSRTVSPPDFVFINGAEPQSLDPEIVTGQSEGRLCQALFEGLIAHNARGEVTPGIAERWEISPNGLVYTFHLRKSEWSNGDPLTAVDFVNSWERTLNPKLASSYAEQLFYIKNGKRYNEGTLTDFSQVGVKALSPDTLQVTLENPSPFFLDLCAFQTLYPVHLPSIQKWGDDWIKPGKLVSNGAYILKDWKINDRVEFEANPHYWRKDQVGFKRVDALTTSQATTAFNIFYSGKADLIIDKSLIPNLYISELRQRPYFHSNPFLGTYFYRFNVKRKPFNDPRVREAFALSIDKKLIVDKITKAGESIANSLTPPGIPGYQPPHGLDYNPELAKKLLTEAGYPGGKGFPPVSLLYNTSESNQQIATEIQAMWKNVLGVYVGLRKQEWKVYLESLDQLDYDIARSSWVGDYNDPNTFLDCFVTGRGNNRTGWSNARYDSLLAQANRLINPQERFQTMQTAETLLVEKELPIAPIYFYVGITLYDGDRLEGLESNVIDEHPLREMHWKKP